MKKQLFLFSLMVFPMLVNCGGNAQPVRPETIKHTFSFRGLSSKIYGQNEFQEEVKDGTSKTYTITTDSKHILRKEDVVITGAGASFDEAKQEINIVEMHNDIKVVASAYKACSFIFVGHNCQINDQPIYAENIPLGGSKTYLITPSFAHAITDKSLISVEGDGALSISLDADHNQLIVDELAGDVRVSVQAKQIFNLNFTGTHCHLQNVNDYDVAIIEDEDATFKVAIDDGYCLLKEDVKIEGLGKDSVSYDSNTKTITVTKMSGDVNILANARGNYNFSFEGTHCNIYGDSKYYTTIPEGTSRDLTVTIDEGYELDKTMIEITGAGKDDVSYVENTHKLIVSNLSGPVTITATATKIVTSTINYNSKNCKATYDATIEPAYNFSVKRNVREREFTISLTPDPGYMLSHHVEVKLDDTYGRDGENYIYRRQSQTLTIMLNQNDKIVDIVVTPIIDTFSAIINVDIPDGGATFSFQWTIAEELGWLVTWGDDTPPTVKTEHKYTNGGEFQIVCFYNGYDAEFTKFSDESKPLIQSIEFYYGMKKINQALFANCNNLIFVYLPKETYEISKSSFSNCSSLFEVYFEENSVLNKIAEDGFSNCGILNRIKIPHTVRTIEINAFALCYNLSIIDLYNFKTIDVVPSIKTDSFPADKKWQMYFVFSSEEVKNKFTNATSWSFYKDRFIVISE